MTGFDAPIPFHVPNQRGWIGVDLDGTLAECEPGNFGPIGKPIPAMVSFVNRLLDAGWPVRIFTARTGSYSHDVHTWCREHIGTDLIVTNTKNEHCFRIYDDRARQVYLNTGEIVDMDEVLEVVAGYKRELDAALQRADKANAAPRTFCSCSYCGQQFDATDLEQAKEQAVTHAAECNKHPMRALDAKLHELEVQRNCEWEARKKSEAETAEAHKNLGDCQTALSTCRHSLAVMETERDAWKQKAENWERSFGEERKTLVETQNTLAALRSFALDNDGLEAVKFLRHNVLSLHHKESHSILDAVQRHVADYEALRGLVSTIRHSATRAGLVTGEPLPDFIERMSNNVVELLNQRADAQASLDEQLNLRLTFKHEHEKDFQAALRNEKLLTLYRDKRCVDGGGGLELPTGQTSKRRMWDAHLHYLADVAIEMAELRISLEQQELEERCAGPWPTTNHRCATEYSEPAPEPVVVPGPEAARLTDTDGSES